MKKLSKEDLKHSNFKNIPCLQGSLYIIATPIGNFDDISLRAIKLLDFVDILLCEDTRKTKKLLSHLNLRQKNLISYNDNNAEKKRPYILKQLLLNKNVGIVSDAGTPLISDPGFKLVKDCYSKKIHVTHAPGPSSVINALVLSGLPTDQFYFGGFISSRKNTKKKQLLKTKLNTMTGIWFDTCLRLEDTLKIMLETYGNRNISITRELTKTYEDVFFGDLVNIQEVLKERQNLNIPLKGEIVIVIQGYNSSSDLDLDELKIIIKNKLENLSLRDTVNKVVLETGLSKKFIYEEAIKIKDKL